MTAAPDVCMLISMDTIINPSPLNLAGMTFDQLALVAHTSATDQVALIRLYDELEKRNAVLRLLSNGRFAVGRPGDFEPIARTS